MKLTPETATMLINVAGIILGIYWFGWWFLVPGIMAGLTYSS